MPYEPANPRPAATVVLVRDDPHPPSGRAPLQVFLQRRVAGMAFAGGMTVFPGGGVDAGDRGGGTAWSGPGAAEWGERLGCDADLAGAFVRAAVRETFEECGVLLAGPQLPDPDRLRQERELLTGRERTLDQVLADNELVLRSEQLSAWARWITPIASPKRYDTAFFVALVPPGQDADAHTTEAAEATWWHPSAALEHWQRGGMQLMAPTFRTLQEIVEHADSASVIAAADKRVVEPVTPRVRREGDRVVIVRPGEPDIDVTADHLGHGGSR